MAGNIVNNACILQYHINNEDGQIDDLDVQGHRNSRSTNPKPYNPLKKSMLESMKKSINQKGSQGVYDEGLQRRRLVEFLVLPLCQNCLVESSKYTMHWR